MGSLRPFTAPLLVWHVFARRKIHTMTTKKGWDVILSISMRVGTPCCIVSLQSCYGVSSTSELTSSFVAILTKIRNENLYKEVLSHSCHRMVRISCLSSGPCTAKDKTKNQIAFLFRSSLLKPVVCILSGVSPTQILYSHFWFRVYFLTDRV